MRLRSFLTILLGVVVAGSAVVYTHAFLKMPGAQEPMRDVVVAVESIPFGQTIDADMLAVQTWPAHAVPNNSFSSVSEFVDEREGQERRAKYALARGDVLITSKVSDFGEPVSITQQIDPTMRAVTISVNDVTGVAGLIAPSDRVDLTLTRNVDQQLLTSTILQDVEVLGIDRPGKSGQRRPGRSKTVTVQVKPADAQKLALAQQAGTLSLSLRHIDAADQQVLESISVGDLTEQVQPRPKKLKRGLPTISVNRGGARETVEVPSG